MALMKFKQTWAAADTASIFFFGGYEWYIFLSQEENQYASKLHFCFLIISFGNGEKNSHSYQGRLLYALSYYDAMGVVFQGGLFIAPATGNPFSLDDTES